MCLGVKSILFELCGVPHPMQRPLSKAEVSYAAKAQGTDGLFLLPPLTSLPDICLILGTCYTQVSYRQRLMGFKWTQVRLPICNMESGRGRNWYRWPALRDQACRGPLATFG